MVYTLWCWHTLRRRWSLKGRERMGSALFEKMKCIFSIVPVGTLDKSRESLTGCCLLEHRTLSLSVRCRHCLAMLG